MLYSPIIGVNKIIIIIIIIIINASLTDVGDDLGKGARDLK